MLDKNANDDVDELIRRSAQMEIPAAVEDRLRRRLTEFRTRVEQRPPSRLRALAYSLMQPPGLRVMAMTAALLVAVAAGVLLLPRQSSASRVYAAAAAQLRGATSLEYSVVLNDEPNVAVDISFLAPGFQRISCSWGIEVRVDRTSGKQIVLFHGTRTYLAEGGKQVESPADSEDFLKQLRSLPQAADELLGEQPAGGKRLMGYRLHKAPDNTGSSEPTAFDIWVDAGTREVDHIDIAIHEAGKPAHQMHIRNIRVSAGVDRSLFDLTPPAGYTAITKPGGAAQATPSASAHDTPAVRVQIGQVGALTVVVLPMTGPYVQVPDALKKVEAYLKTQGVAPAGPPLGRFWDERHWETGYPVPLGTRAEAPFEVVTLPAGLAASAVVKGPWGQDSGGRWAAFLQSVVEQGYAPAGPAMEVWRGEEGKEAGQVTEMRMAVAKGK
jgi:effector-binding domain-containing protein